MLDHKRWSQEEDRFWTHLNDIHYPIPLASTLPRCAAATPSFLDDLVQRMDHFALQLRESLDKPTDRRPSFHKAIILAARYSFCGAAVARTCRMQATSEEEEVTFRSYNTKFAEKASGLAQLAFVGAALFYYENCGLQASSPILGPQKRLPEDGAALVAAWIRSLRTYSVPQDNVSLRPSEFSLGANQTCFGRFPLIYGVTLPFIMTAVRSSMIRRIRLLSTTNRHWRLRSRNSYRPLVVC